MSLQLPKINEKTFNRLILPHMPKSKRSSKCKLSYYQRFNRILHRLKTGTQWRSMEVAINGLERKYSCQNLYYYFKVVSK